MWRRWHLVSVQVKEDEHSGVYVSWRLTNLAKVSVDVFSHELSRKGLQ